MAEQSEASGDQLFLFGSGLVRIDPGRCFLGMLVPICGPIPGGLALVA